MCTIEEHAHWDLTHFWKVGVDYGLGASSFLPADKRVRVYDPDTHAVLGEGEDVLEAERDYKRRKETRTPEEIEVRHWTETFSKEDFLFMHELARAPFPAPTGPESKIARVMMYGLAKPQKNEAGEKFIHLTEEGRGILALITDENGNKKPGRPGYGPDGRDLPWIKKIELVYSKWRGMMLNMRSRTCKI